MRFQDLRNHNIIIWGAGRDGISALQYLKKVLPDTHITIFSDQALPGETIAKIEKTPGVRFSFGKNIIEYLSSSDVIIKSPGVSLYRDDIKRGQNNGAKFISTTNLWFSEVDLKKIIAVTGTKGKSTTASIVYHCLKKKGIKVELVGNIGNPMLNYLDNKDQVEAFVVELSSYQTADINYTPHISILVNLFPEHIDWHGSTDNYYRDKLHLFNPGEFNHTILNYKDKNTQLLTSDWRFVTYFEHSEFIHTKDQIIYYGANPVGAIDNRYLQGNHNLSNICAALTGLKAAGYDPLECFNLMNDFVGLKHRQEILGAKNGITYVDDSISTTPETAMAAIHRFSGAPLTLLLGGFDRKQNYEELIRLICSKNIHMVITMPENGNRIASILRQEIGHRGYGPALLEADDLLIAVNTARQKTPRGGVILLSPAAPSYGCFMNFEERGDFFRRAAGFL